MNAIRVPTAVFKSNVRPYVDQAKAGNTVIVTCDGQDDFQVVPLTPGRPTPLPLGCPKQSGDPDAPAFESLDADEPLA